MTLCQLFSRRTVFVGFVSVMSGACSNGVSIPYDASADRVTSDAISAIDVAPQPDVAEVPDANMVDRFVMPDVTQPVDASAGDLHGWTAEGGGPRPQGIIAMAASLVTPRKLVVLFRGTGSGTGSLLTEWHNGIFEHSLAVPLGVTGYPVLLGLGYAHSDTAYVFLAYAGSIPFHLIHGGATGWTDDAFSSTPPGGASSWPPRTIAIAAGASDLVYLYNETAFYSASISSLHSADVRNSTPQLEGTGIAWAAVDPNDHTRVIAGVDQNVRICHVMLDSVSSCAPAVATGFGVGETQEHGLIHPTDSQRVYAFTSSGSVTKVYRSRDGAATFAPIVLTSLTGSAKQLVLDPTRHDVIALTTAAGLDVPNHVYVSMDAGGSFRELALPFDGVTTPSAPAVAFDSAGTLFLTDGIRIYSIRI